ncbi:phoenix isoform X2 [Ictalurus punctatus]|uniref:Phoenix isoform X2 n=1 Tax=Ictalurus punctatus TaxID=7998 RepID=A0A2D0QDW6_ICTPU|nr:phoenix isoform X2 [Ictalurus punctatus]
MSFIVTRSRSKLGLGENISKDSVQSDSQREIARESPASESDSGDSLFLTQSVTSPSRTVKRHHPSNDPPCPFSQEVEDVHEKAGGRNAQHKDTGVSSDSDSETTYDVLLRRWKLLANSRGRINQRPRPSRKRVSPKWMGVPFLKKSVSVRKKQTIVDKDCFIENTHKRNQQTWLPSLKWKTRQAPETCTKKSNKCQEEQETCSQTRKVAEDLMAPQDDADVYNESSSLNIEVSRSTENGEKSRKSAEWNWMEPIDETSDEETQRPNLVDQDEDETQILQDNPMDREGREDAPCLENISSCEHQVQVQDIHQGVHHEPLGNETQILQDNPTDKEGKEDALCFENISSCEHQVQVQDIHQSVHHEPLENEDFGSVSGGFISSQDLFQEPNNQSSPLKETSVENDKEVLESIVVPHDDIGLIIKKKGSLILEDMEGDFLKYSKSLRTHPSEIVSPTAGDICQVRKEKDKTTLDMQDPHHHSSLPLEDYESGSIGNDYSSCSKDILMVRQEEKTETPLFNFGGLKFLKRKKNKKTKDPEISDNLAPRQADLGQNEYSALHFDDVKRKKRRKVKNDRLLEETVYTLPDISIAADSSLLVQDSSVVCASVSGSKPKRKKGKNDWLLEEPVDTLPDISVAADSSLSVQDSSVVCASVSGSKPKRKKGKNDWLLEEPVDTLPDISVAADSGLSVQDSSVVCATVCGSKPKSKKDKNYRLLEEPVDTLPDISVAADSGLSVQDSSVVCATVSGSKAKKKRKKDKNDRLLEEPVDTLPDISIAADSGLSVQDSSVVCASVSGSKPKRKKGKNDWLLEEPVDTLPDISVAADSGLSVQDSSVVCATVSGSKAKKKRKKDKNDRLLEEPVDTLPDISVAADSGLSVQDSSVVCASLSGSKPKRKKDKNYRLLEEPVDTLPDISVAADSGLSVQDSSVVCASVSGSKAKKKRKKDKNDRLLEEPVDTLPDISVAADSSLSVQDSSVVCASVSGSKPKRKKDKNDRLLEEPVDTLPDISVAADSSLSVQDSSVVCASVSGSKPKSKKDKNYRLLEEPVDTLPDISVAADSGLSVQDSSVVCASVNGIKPKKKRKKDKHGQPVPQEDEWIGVEEAIQIPCQGSASLVSIAEETEQLTRTDLSNFVQSDCLEPQRKKKKKRAKTKQDSSPVITEIVAWQCSEESYSSHGIKTVKKKKKTFIDDVGEGQVGEMATASKNIGEPLEKIPEIPAGIEIQPVNSIDLTDDSITQRKKRKKRKRQKVVREENMDVEALLVETTEQVEAPNTQDSEQQAAEVVLVRKPKKKKGRIKTHQEEETSKNASVSLRLDLIEMTTSNTPSTRSETGGIGEEEGVGGSEPVKKKKKKRKRKELENDGSWSVSHGLLHLDDSHWQNTKQTRVVKEASSSGQNDTNETNKCERTKDDRSESSQQVLQSEDTIQPNGRKKKKKKKKKQWVETDIEVYPEIVEHELWQESGSPSEPSEAIIEKEKKKKNRKDTVDRGGNQILDVVPKLFAAEESRDALDTCHAKKDSISSSGGALLVHIKKKKQVRDPDNDLDALGAEKVAVSGKSNWCSWTDSAKLKKKRKRDHL